MTLSKDYLSVLVLKKYFVHVHLDLTCYTSTRRSTVHTYAKILVLKKYIKINTFFFFWSRAHVRTKLFNTRNKTLEYIKINNENKCLVRTWALDRNQAQMRGKWTFLVKNAILTTFGT